MEARRPFDTNEDPEQIDAVVARIKARGITPLPKPSPEAVALFLAHTAHEAPMDSTELAEHERMWRAVDALIAAAALRHDLVVLTTDNDFTHVPQLRMENWLAP